MFKGLRKINKLKLLGTTLLILGLFVFAKTYWPVLNSYFNYYFKNNSSGTVRVEMTSKQEEITKEINKDTQTVFVDSNTYQQNPPSYCLKNDCQNCQDNALYMDISLHPAVLK